MNCTRIAARRCLTALVLVSFTVGNIGLPLPALKAGKGQCRTIAGKSLCCCGEKVGAAACGCCKKPAVATGTVALKEPAKKIASCCQKRLEKMAARQLAFSCSCGDSSFPGMIISSQPKLPVASPAVPQLALSSLAPVAVNVTVPQGNLSPETPPPRASVA
jgi:hypothetical protein